MSRIIINDFSHPHFFWKDFLGGMLICLGMTGLDQNMMQKNLSCRSREDAALNLKMFSGVVLVVNIFFLLLGYLLYHQEMVKEWISTKGVIQTDSVFPAWVLENGTKWIIIWFVLGLTAASFNSADSVMTTLTTSWYIDVLGNKPEESSQEKTRTRIHAFFALAIFVCITLFYFFNNNALIDTVLFLGGVTYGPLLGIFLFGLLFSGNISPLRLMLVIISGMTISLILYYYLKNHPDIYRPGVDFILWNTAIHLLLLYLFSEKKTQHIKVNN
jgi:Na+/proline symporter